MENTAVKKKNLANNLKDLREINKLKQSDLADKMSVSLKSVSHWETGYSEPSIDQLIKLSEIFNITLDELVLY